MADNDTVRLLRECGAGTKMAISSIDSVLDRVQSQKLGGILSLSKEKHLVLGDEIGDMLTSLHDDEKEPNPMAKGMATIKTDFKMGVNESDGTAADLITDGCNMGVKSLRRYMNKYKAASPESMDVCCRLIDIEQRLCSDVSPFL